MDCNRKKLWAKVKWFCLYKQFGSRLLVVALGLLILGMTVSIGVYVECAGMRLLEANNAWILLVLFLVGLFLCLVDIEKIRLFRFGNLEFELQNEIKEVRDRAAELLQTEANLHKAQGHFACAVWDYARAANKYAELGKWDQVKQMCGMTIKLSAIKDGELSYSSDDYTDQIKKLLGSLGEELESKGVDKLYDLLSPSNRLDEDGTFVKLDGDAPLRNALQKQMEDDFKSDESKNKVKEAKACLRDVRWKDTFGSLGYFAQSDVNQFLDTAIDCIEKVIKMKSERGRVAGLKMMKND